MTSNLKIRPLSCKLTKEQESYQSMTPVFKILIGSSAETATIGKFDQDTIIWDEELHVKKFQGKTVHIEIWDSERKSLIGRGEKAFESPNINTSEWIQLFDGHNHAVGQVLVEIEGNLEETDIDHGDQMEGIPKHMLPHESYFDLQSKLNKFLRPYDNFEDLQEKATYTNYFYSSS
jgi:hypothetical protein